MSHCASTLTILTLLVASMDKTKQTVPFEGHFHPQQQQVHKSNPHHTSCQKLLRKPVDLQFLCLHLLRYTMPIAIIPDDTVGPDSSTAHEARKCTDSQDAYGAGVYPARRNSDTFATIRLQREHEGRCADCGMQTHELHFDQMTHAVVKSPLTIEGEVHRGRCLFCHPILSRQLPGNYLSCQPLSDQHPLKRSDSEEFSHTIHAKRREPNCRSVNRCVSDDSLFPRATRFGGVDPVVNDALSVINGSSFDIVDILSAMNRVPHNRTVQECGCERLWILSWEEENSAAIGRVGGISIILNAMARFPFNAHLQQCGCESLQNLAHSDYNRREICDQSGIELIVKSMVHHKRNAGIQQCGCTALASIASSSCSAKVHCNVIEQTGGLDAILEAARNFIEEKSVREAAYDALQAMGLNAGGRITPAFEAEEESQSSLVEDMDI